MVLLGSAATHSWGLPQSGHHAWGKACGILFGWDTRFCKKLKKKKSAWSLPCACVFLEGVPTALRCLASPFPGHPWSQAQPRETQIRLL